MSDAPAIAVQRAADFACLVELTRRMRDRLEAGEWGDAADLEAERRVVIERVFDVAPSAAELPVLTATLREVVRLNDELIGFAEHRRRALEREADTLAVGRSAVRAYSSLGGDAA